ncbi:MAG: Maf family protein [Halioglobus sp.]
MDLILASTSVYRRNLLARLPLEFRCENPEVDETAAVGEAPEALARRLALAKANSVSQRFPGALVIGSDQVASRDGQLLGKPGNERAAFDQLSASSGQRVAFHTAVALVGGRSERQRVHVELVEVKFRELERAEIQRYLAIDEPFDCAGSFKVEQLGIALFEKIVERDPTSLQGLPLIALCSMLRDVGYLLP